MNGELRRSGGVEGSVLFYGRTEGVKGRADRRGTWNVRRYRGRFEGWSRLEIRGEGGGNGRLVGRRA